MHQQKHRKIEKIICYSAYFQQKINSLFMLMCKWIQLDCVWYFRIFIHVVFFFFLYFCNQKFFAPQSISGNTRPACLRLHDIPTIHIVYIPCLPPRTTTGWFGASDQITLSIFGWRTFRVFDFDEWMNEKITNNKNKIQKINEYNFLHVISLSSSLAVCFVCDNKYKTQRCLTSCCESDSLLFVDMDRQSDSLEDPCFFRYS